MKKAKVILALVLAVVLFAGGAVLGYQAHDFSLFKQKQEINTLVVKEQLIDLADLTTQELSITDVESFSANKEFKGHKLPLTTKQIIVAYDAVIKAATDLSEAKVDVTENEAGTTVLNVTLMKCAITDMYIDENSWKYLDAKSGLFNKLKIEDDKTLRDSVMKVLNDRAKDRDVIGAGNEQAKKVVADFLAKAYPEAEVVVEVK